MDATVWFQASDDAGGDFSPGDIVLTPRSDVVQVAEVGGDGDLAVRAEVAPTLLPGLPEGGSGVQQVADEELLRAVRGVITAERERGG